MDFAQAVEYLEALTDFERLGFHRHFAEAVNLDAARKFMETIGDPHLKIPCVHIAGTKGKGSTAALIESVLRASGRRTGLFTSPHLVSFRERIRIDGIPIPEADVARYVERVQPAVEAVRGMPGLSPCTFFETYMGVAALHFLNHKVDVVIWETGLGGRLDATNLVTPLVGAITTIGFDHMGILGDTLDAIAREKAGIAKPGVPLLVARGQAEEALKAIREVASANGAEVVSGPEVRRVEPPRKARAREDRGFERPVDKFDVGGSGWSELAGREPQPQGRGAGDGKGHAQILECALVGAHQAGNLGVALGVLEQLAQRGYTVSEEDVAKGLRKVRWPGRFDIRRVKPWVVLDCAHNPESGRALARALPEYLDSERIVLVVGMSEDKDVAGFAKSVAGLGAEVVLTRAQMPRALSPEDLQQRAKGAWYRARLVDDAVEALNLAAEMAGEGGAVCVTGSFYVVGEIMQRLGMET